MRSAPILARYPQRRSDLRTFRRSDIASSFLPITSLQPLRFHAIAHSFPQRRQPISFSLNSFRTLLPLTTDSFFRTHISARSRGVSLGLSWVLVFTSHRSRVTSHAFSYSCRLFVVSLPSFLRSFRLFSIACSLFSENTRGGG